MHGKVQVVPVAAALLELGVAAAFSKLAQNAVSWFSGRSIFRKLQFCAAACTRTAAAAVFMCRS